MGELKNKLIDNLNFLKFIFKLRFRKFFPDDEQIKAFDEFLERNKRRKTSNKNSDKLGTAFNPNNDLNDKLNFQRFSLIDKEGNIKEKILLFITNTSIREMVIFTHFINRYISIFLRKAVAMKFLSRDNPWDFEVELSNGERLFIEITSIADDENVFKDFKFQERIVDKSHFEYIEFHEIIKINNYLKDKGIELLIKELKDKKTNKNHIIKNPIYNRRFIFQTNLNENLDSFTEILKQTIEKKTKKNHKNKQEVILIIDNRTVSFDFDSVTNHINDLSEYFENLPFKEVWFYTGYYSDFNGDNAEYTLIPLKLSEQKKIIIFQKLNKETLKEKLYTINF